MSVDRSFDRFDNGKEQDEISLVERTSTYSNLRLPFHSNRKKKAGCCRWTIWAPIVYGSFVAALIAVPMALVTINGSSNSYIADQYDSFWACLPNGTVVQDMTYEFNGYAANMFFDITLPVISSTFSATKAIDVCFDIIIGRGIQLILLIITYKVLKGMLLLSMQSRPSSIEKYSAICFQPGSITTGYTLAKELFRKDSKRPWIMTCQLVCAVLAAIYVGTFSAAISAVSGYQAISEAYIPNPNDQSLIAASNMSYLWYTIVDGDRVGLTKNYQVAAIEPEDNAVVTGVYNYFTSLNVLQGGMPGDNSPQDRWTQTDFNATLNPLNQSSVFSTSPQAANGEEQLGGGQNFTLDAPTLTIIAYWPESEGPFYYEGAVVSKDYVMANAVCKPTTSYQWGFSLLGITLVLAFTSFYAAMMYIIWLTTHLHSRPAYGNKKIGHWRALMDIAAAIHRDVGPESDQLDAKELDKEIEVKRPIVHLRTSDLPPTRMQARRRRTELRRQATQDQGSVELERVPSYHSRDARSYESLPDAERAE